MNATSELIETLVADARPVRRLRPPLVRAALWLVIATLILVAVALLHGVREDLPMRLGGLGLDAASAASLLTGALAVVAVFMVCQPDRSSRWLWLPVPAALLWASTLGYDCLINWVAMRGSPRLSVALECLTLVTAVSAPLLASLLVMVRHALLVRPVEVTVMSCLAVAAIATSIHMLFHTHDASVLILAWNVGTLLLLLGVGRLIAPILSTLAAPRAALSTPPA